MPEIVDFENLSISKQSEKEWEMLGEGGYCRVYLCEHSGTKVAVKIYRGVTISNDKQFKQEIEVLRQENHKLALTIKQSETPKHCHTLWGIHDSLRYDRT